VRLGCDQKKRAAAPDASRRLRKQPITCDSGDEGCVRTWRREGSDENKSLG